MDIKSSDKEKVFRLNNKLKIYENKILHLKQLNIECENKYLKLQSQIASSSFNHNELSNVNLKLSESCKAFQLELKSRDEEVAKLNYKLKEYQSNCKKLSSKEVNYSVKIDSASNSINELNAKISLLNSQSKKKENDLISKQEQINTLQSQIASASFNQNEISNVSLKLSESLNQCKAFQLELQSRDEEVAKLNSKLKEYQINSWKTQIDTSFEFNLTQMEVCSNFQPKVF